MYVCPLCLKGFQEDEALSDLTREDVPPRSLGGRKLLLTCRDCNSRTGHELDWHARVERDIMQFLAGHDYPPLSARMGMHAANVEIRKVDDINVIEFLSKNNPPLRTGQVLEEASEWGDGTEIEFKLARRFIPRRADISWLKSAYLLTFAWLGYRYICRDIMNGIRDQINEPAKLHIRTFCMFDHSADALRMVVVQEPAVARGIAVTAHGRIVLLPLFDDDRDFYPRLFESDREILKIHGRSFGWPDKAMYRLDHATPEELAAFWSLRW